MNGSVLPLWIIGGPFLGLLFLTSIYKGGSSASSAVRRREEVEGGPGTGGYPDYAPGGYVAQPVAEHSLTLEQISRLSGPVSPGSISELSGRKSPGAISRLSAGKSPGAISRLSGPKSPGAISRLSGPKSPGAISALSRPRPVGSIATLSNGFYVSHLFGLPLLTRSQRATEPDGSLLIRDSADHRQDR